MFEIDKLESTLCNDCRHTTNHEDSSNVQTISGMLHQLMDPMGEYLKNYRCVDGCQKLNTSTKAVNVTKLSDALIIQLTNNYTNNMFNILMTSVKSLFPI